MSATAEDLSRWIREAAPAARGSYVHRVWRAGEHNGVDETWVILARHHEGSDPSARALSRLALEASLVGEVSRLVALPPEDVSADDKKLKKAWAKDSFPFLSLLRRHLGGARLTEIAQLEGDRVAQLRFEHDPDAPGADAIPREGPRRLVLCVELIGRQGNLILAHEDDPSAAGPVVIGSLHAGRKGRPFEKGLPYRPPPPREHTEPQPATLQTEIEPDPETLALGRAVARALKGQAEEQAQDSRLGQLRRDLKKALKRTEGLQKKLSGQLAEVADADRYEAEGDLLKANLAQLKRGMTSITLTDYASGEAQEVRLELDPAKDPLENMKARYKRAKKLRRGETNVLMRQGETDAQLAAYAALLAEAQALEPEDEDALEALEEKARREGALPKRKAPKQKQQENTGPRRYRTKESHLVLVGRNDDENDKLTMRIARGNDLFFHVAGCPGSHVILRVDPKRPPNHESLVDAATLAVYYSKARQRGKVDVHYTPRKWVKKPRGAKPGLVQISNFKTVRAGGDADRLKRMLDSLERDGDVS